ncbi:hypothetical protein BDZ88DRAFT_418205 [Geranomyces variabilis]|nr:hypothetical protein BDZ88DRAFT_418205 [Geranomyces variabilis]KAJ3140599.1 hypothetical protein HDU90_007901 [Geranomyces variabilis]
MDKSSADPAAERAPASGRVSEAVRSLRSNLDKKYASKPSDVPTRHSSKVRRQVAAIENPASVPALDAQIAASARGKIEAFERLAKGAGAAAPAAEITSVKKPAVPPMTPGRKAAVASKRVSTRSQSCEPETAPAAASCATPRAWPEIRTRKVLFEPNSKDASKDTSVGNPPLTPTRRSQRLSTAAGNDDNSIDKPSDTIPDVNMPPTVTYPNPFDDDEDNARPGQSIFAGVPSPIRKSIRVAARASSVPISAGSVSSTLTEAPKEFAIEAAESSNRPESLLQDSASNSTETGNDIAGLTSVGDAQTKPATTTTLPIPKTPTKINTLTKEQKAAMKTPSKSVARRSARKVRLPDGANNDSSAEDVLGTPTKKSGTAESPEDLDAEAEQMSERVAQTPSRGSARFATLDDERANPVVATKPLLVDEEVQTIPMEAVEGAGKRKRGSSDDEEEEVASEEVVVEEQTREKRRKVVLEQDAPAASKKKRVAFSKSSSKKTRASKKPAVAQYDANVMDVDGLFSTDQAEQWTEEQTEEKEKEEGVNSDDEGGWLLSVFFKAARLAGLR